MRKEVKEIIAGFICGAWFFFILAIYARRIDWGLRNFLDIFGFWALVIHLPYEVYFKNKD